MNYLAYIFTNNYLDLLLFEIGWMVLEIWEGGNPPNLADSLGIESIDEYKLQVAQVLRLLSIFCLYK